MDSVKFGQVVKVKSLSSGAKDYRVGDLIRVTTSNPLTTAKYVNGINLRTGVTVLVGMPEVEAIPKTDIKVGDYVMVTDAISPERWNGLAGTVTELRGESTAKFTAEVLSGQSIPIKLGDTATFSQENLTVIPRPGEYYGVSDIRKGDKIRVSYTENDIELTRTGTASRDYDGNTLFTYLGVMLVPVMSTGPVTVELLERADPLKGFGTAGVGSIATTNGSDYLAIKEGDNAWRRISKSGLWWDKNILPDEYIAGDEGFELTTVVTG